MNRTRKTVWTWAKRVLDSSSLISHSKPQLSSLQGHICKKSTPFFFTKPVLNQPWKLFGAIVIRFTDFALTINHLQILLIKEQNWIRLIRSRFSRHYQVKKLIYHRLIQTLQLPLTKVSLYIYICIKQRLQFSYKNIKFTRCLIKTHIFYLRTKMPVFHNLEIIPFLFLPLSTFFLVSWSN